jgi:hypothetical protein
MAERDVAEVVEELESLGIKLTVTPRLDGSLRLNCWRMMSSWQHAARIKEILAEHVENPARAAEIANFVNRRSMPTLAPAMPTQTPSAPTMAPPSETPARRKGKRKSQKDRAR